MTKKKCIQIFYKNIYFIYSENATESELNAAE